MESFEYDHNIFSRNNAGDDSLFVVFYMGTMKNEGKTEIEGRLIVDDIECVRIIIPGDKNSLIDRPASADDKKRFVKQYQAFKTLGTEDAQISGTRLKDWPYMSRAQCEELNYLGMKTVEQLAEVRDDIVGKVPGLQTLKANAKVWLAKSKSTAESAAITRQLNEQAQQIADLKEIIRQQGIREDARALAGEK